MKVAICGLSPTKDQYRERQWNEVWGLPWDPEYFIFDRHFEMHDRELWSERDEGYGERLASLPRLYTQENYPFEDLRGTVFKNFPRWDQEDWYNDSPAYMLALAIHEGAEEIGIYGVDLADKPEYGLQKPCLDFLIGVAMGKGIKVHLPEGPTNLLKFQGEGIPMCSLWPTYHKRYGRLSGDHELHGTQGSGRLVA